MPLIVEDGSIVANANSYVNLVFARDYALARNLTLPVDDLALEQFLIKAVDYIESFRNDFSGNKTDPLNQLLQWPRAEVKIDGVFISASSIPIELKKAQVQLAAELQAGVVIQPTRQGGFIIEDKTGPLMTKYSEKIGTSLRPTMTAVDSLLEVLFSNGSQQFALTTIRV